MAQQTHAATSRGADGAHADIKRKLAMRMGVAGVMIVALLGGLALFDYLSKQQAPEQAAPHFTEPVPVGKKAPLPVEPEPPRPEKKAVEAQASPDKPIPSLEAPPKPEVAAQPSLPASSPGSSATASKGGAGPAAAPRPAAPPAVASSGPALQQSQGQLKSAPQARSSEPKRALAPAEPEGSSAPPMPVSRSEPEPALREAKTAQPPPPAPPRLFSGYGVQAGVFADPRRAEELHARLVQAGIPASIESRVQVGPFKTREQAEAARAKLKELGIDGVLLPPRGEKR